MTSQIDIEEVWVELRKRVQRGVLEVKVIDGEDQFRKRRDGKEP